MSKPIPPIYRTKNWPEYNRALKQRGSLTIWFNPEITWKAAPTGKRGRQPRYTDAAIQACLTIKILFGLPLRQATGFVESLLKLVDPDWEVPDFSTLCRRQKTLSVAIPYQGSRGPLNLLIDSTGIKAEGEGEWNARKHPSHRNCVSTAGQWVAPSAACGAKYTSIARQSFAKQTMRGGIDEETLEIRAIEVTGSNIGPSHGLHANRFRATDAPILPDLLGQIGPDQEIGCVTADGAYDTRKCYDAIIARNAHPVIPLRKNAKPWKPDTPGARERNEAIRSSKYLGRALWRHLTGYHRRSRVETKMNCMKLLGQRLSPRDFDRQVAEVQIRAAILNGFTALGIPRTVTVG